MSVTEIHGRANGPLRLTTGPCVLVDAEGKETKLEGGRIALCRCGHSKNKPFCDGSHRSASFEAAEFTIRWPEETQSST